VIKHTNHPIILYKYLTKDLFKFFLFTLFFLIILIFFIDLIELFRRSANKIGVNHLLKADFIDLTGMASLKIIGNIQKILPFAALIGSIACFNQWRKKNYYIISKVSGISLWKILSPILVSFFFVGLFSIIILNPFSTLMNKKYENLQTLFFGKANVKEFSFDTKGFWIKHKSEKRNLIINANKIDKKTHTLFDLNIFEYDDNKIFQKKIRAVQGKFTSQKLLLDNVQTIDRNYKMTTLKKSYYSINFDSSQLNVATKNPEKIFLLDFPYYLIKMKSYGLNISKHLVHFFKLICQPFLIISMILLSASLMLRSSERKVEGGIVSLSLIVGFSLYFIGDFIFALGFSEKIPPLLAGFGPTLIGLFSGCYLISDIDEVKYVKKR
jgi:lipopolysaccharide export system permease protein